MDRLPVYRPEALDAARSRFGSPVRPVGVATWVLTAFLLALFATTGVFVASARYARKETVPGILSPTDGAVRISSTRAGVISTVHVAEGDRVAAGQPLVTVSLDARLPGGASLGSLLSAAAEAEGRAISMQAAAQAESLTRQLEEAAARRAGLLADRQRLTADLELQTQRVRLASETAEATRKLFDKQLIAAVTMRQRDEAVLAARQALGSIERQRDDIGAQLAQLQAQEGRLRAEAANAAAQAAAGDARMSEKRASLAGETDLALTASRAGVVAALQAKAGATVAPGQALAVVLPSGEGLEADLWVPSRAAGFVKPGDPVRLMYDAFPYQRFGVGRGRVRKVGRAPVAPQDLPAPMAAQESLYQVTVTLAAQDVAAYGRRWALAPGMRLTADLVLDDRPLLAWLFDPVLAARRRSGP